MKILEQTDDGRTIRVTIELMAEVRETVTTDDGSTQERVVTPQRVLELTFSSYETSGLGEPARKPRALTRAEYHAAVREQIAEQVRIQMGIPHPKAPAPATGRTAFVIADADLGG